MIKVNDLTLQYHSGKGVFDLNFEVKEGEVVGYLGPNGAGKTTTIRALMGFIKPDKGNTTINGLDSFSDAPKIMKSLGYLPGEISFIDGMTGEEYLKYMADVRGLKDLTRQKELIEMFEFSPKGNIKKYSKGMKQKLGIVAAFMHDPDVLILDEPTSGLDPLMQNRFVELILEEKKKGKTILMSSHMFEEVERTCDNVLIIKDGRIVAHSDIETLKNTQRKGFEIKTPDIDKAVQVLREAGFNAIANNGVLEVYVTGDSVDKFIKTCSLFMVTSLDIKAQTLEDVFMHFYSKEAK
ncbi:MAG: ABC transporter ATP-binding protein [Anaerorhabdus sp.]|uniref:ABC transporter ATP-binding protein n=1 Tax=Anaerorhabdus sp. TaxID=1872524 RepID=UPI003A896A67